MTAKSVQAIDVHAHVGTYACGNELHRRFMSGNAARVVKLATQARTALTVVSALEAFFPEGRCDVLGGNEAGLRAVRRSKRLLLWAVLDPRKPKSFAQVERLLAHPKCAGIKIHPELHRYPIGRHGRAVFEFAAKHRAIVQSHSGQPNSLPVDFVRFADAFPEVTLILSHLGFGWDDDYSWQVRAIQRSRNGNIYTDTSSAKSLTPNLLEWAVREVGADRILYGTDSPLYFAPMHRARIDCAELSDADKRLILRGNAQGLLSSARTRINAD